MLIYRIINRTNGKIYIGQTIRNLNQRWVEHCSKNTCPHLNNAIKKYGRDNFTIEEIFHTFTIEDLNWAEQYFISYYNSLTPNGYNLTTGGLNHLYSEESRQKISKALKGKPKSEEHKKNMFKFKKNNIPWNKGKHHSEETKKKLSIFNKGKKQSEETVKKRVLAFTGKKHYLFGKHHSEEIKEKISNSLKGKNHPLFGKSLPEKCRIASIEARQRKIICIENGNIYDSIKKAADELKLFSSNIVKVLKGEYKTTGKYTFRYLENKNA